MKITLGRFVFLMSIFLVCLGVSAPKAIEILDTWARDPAVGQVSSLVYDMGDDTKVIKTLYAYTDEEGVAKTIKCEIVFNASKYRGGTLINLPKASFLGGSEAIESIRIE